jgi:hypothetical protein
MKTVMTVTTVMEPRHVSLIPARQAVIPARPVRPVTRRPIVVIPVVLAR